MLFTGFISSLLSNNKQEYYNSDDDSSFDEKKSICSETAKFRDDDGGVLRKLRRTGSNRSLFKLSLKKSFNFSSPSVNSVNTITTVSPPSPTQAAPLWKEQVDSNTKNGLNPSEIHRQEIMFEIIQTEKAFVEDLRFLIDRFVITIQESGIRLPPNLEKTFTILPDILLLHFNVSLQLLCLQAIMYPVVPSIAHILKDMTNHFYSYESYLIHHKMAISEISDARKKNNKLGQLIKDLEADISPGRILTLESLLTKPFQRLCKYPLLVMTLLRATVPDHQDRESLIDLYNQVDCALRELQERKSEYDRMLENERKLGSFGRNKFTSNGRYFSR